MKVSVITVCFNSSKSIRNTFESIKKQSYKDIEFLVIDGGSIDGTLEIIEEYKSIISVLISEPDKGLYDALNKGISFSSGELIGVLHSDDVFFDDNVVENIVEFHKKNKIDASIGNIIQVNSYGKKVRKYSAKNWSPKKLKLGFMPAHPSVFFKRVLFEKYGKYHLDFTSAADYELIVRFFLKHNISWSFFNITTTVMSRGGISSSGFASYKLISNEIAKALSRNSIPFSPMKIKLRGLWKLFGILRNS